MASKSREEIIEDMFTTNYCNEDHIQAFARTLSEVEEEVPSSPVLTRSALRHQPTPGNPAVPKHLHHTRVRKVSAMSDFAPIHTKIKRRVGRTPRPSMQSEPLFLIFRWPLLLLLNTIIGFEFGLYVFIRQLVNAFEWLLAWRGPKRTLRSHLRNARSWQEWKLAAAVLDEFLGFNEWKTDDEDPYYDYRLVRKVRRSLAVLRANDDAYGLMELLEVCLRDNFAGTQSARLYAETFYGTKDAIEALANEMEAALAYIRTSPNITVEEKRRFYRNANRNLGSSALCLSGGASFGFYHFGVIKAFLDANLLPRVFNGTSAGTLAAAFACTHTDEELRLLLSPRIADCITAFEEPVSTIAPRLYHTGAMFDAVQWARKSTWFTRGSMTFREAYERTGKVLNISVIPADQHSPTKLLNYLTAPNCVIWSAAIASSAVPTIINPVVLMQKTKHGDVVPWNWGTKFKDGSLRVDVPIQSLNLLFNVNYPIVSQVNPHIHLFWFAPRGSAGKPVAHRKGKGWRGGFLLSAAEQFLKLELTKNFKVIRDLELMPQIIGQDWSSVFLQRFDGSITIHPRTVLKDFLRILTDPDRPNMERMMHAGELATWPTLHMIENRFRLEREIFRGRLAVRQQNLSPLDGRDLPAPDTDPVHTRLEGGLGASSSQSTTSFPTLGSSTPPSNSADNGRPSLTLSSSRGSQLAIESEAEEDFANNSPSFFKRPKSLHRSGGSSHHSRRTSPIARRPPTLHIDGDDDSQYARASSVPHSRRTSSATIRARVATGDPGRGSRTSGSTTPSKLISRLRNHSFPHIPKFRRRRAAHQDGDDDGDTSPSEGEHDARNHGTLAGAGTFALPDAWSSEDSSDDPAFDLDASLENTIESNDEEVLGLQNAADDGPAHEAPEQDA